MRQGGPRCRGKAGDAKTLALLSCHKLETLESTGPVSSSVWFPVVDTGLDIAGGAQENSCRKDEGRW